MKATESDVEDAALEWLEALGWRIVHGPDIAPGLPYAERADYGEVVPERRLRDTLAASTWCCSSTGCRSG